VDDIEIVFKTTSMLAARIRNIFNTGMGGNPFPLYIEFKVQFDFLFTMSCDHKSIREKDINKKVMVWRDAPGLSYLQMVNGLKLFEEYKTQLFKAQLLRYM
jgi:hypothetical protein